MRDPHFDFLGPKRKRPYIRPTVGRRSWQCDPDLRVKVRYGPRSTNQPTRYYTNQEHRVKTSQDYPGFRGCGPTPLSGQISCFFAGVPHSGHTPETFPLKSYPQFKQHPARRIGVSRNTRIVATAESTNGIHSGMNTIRSGLLPRSMPPCSGLDSYLGYHERTPRFGKNRIRPVTSVWMEMSQIEKRTPPSINSTKLLAVGTTTMFTASDASHNAVIIATVATEAVLANRLHLRKFFNGNPIANKRDKFIRYTL